MKNHSKTFFSYAMGCRVNEAEKEVFDRRLTEAGFTYTPDVPSIYIFNSCAVTGKAERETRQHIYQIRKKYPKTMIVVTGCSATYWKKLGRNTSLPVDLLIDNSDKQYLVKMIINRFLQPYVRNLPGCVRSRIKIKNISNKFLRSGRAMIKIQDGCQRFCSYCIVPYLRGLPKSNLIKDIVKEINSLKNIKEIVLTAINTEAFGYDTKESLIDLIDAVIYKTKIPRISFGSIHPWSIDRKFIDYYRSIKSKNRLANFFHVPLQSGSDKILKLMKRDYSVKDFAWKINAIKKVNPFAMVATDVIVGFLGETGGEFQKTYKFLEKTPIDRFHIFRFSSRDNTAVYHMKERLSEAPPDVKIKRAKALADLSQKKYNQFLQFLADNNYRSSSLFLDKFENGHQQALLDNQVPVWIKTDKSLTGEMKNVQVNKITADRLSGELI